MRPLRLPVAPAPRIVRETNSVALTGVGRVRTNNEDCVGIREELLVLSDGMGGHAHGEVASDAAVRTFLDYAKRVRSQRAEGVLDEAFRLAQRTVALVPDGAGCTLVAVRVEERCVVVAHTGDSRAYLLRRGNAISLTRDHAVQGMLTRCLGGGGHVAWEPTIARIATLPGDAVMLCSDGLHGMIDDETLGSLWDAAGGDIERFAVDAHNEAMVMGGDDNCSIVVARCL